MQTIFFPSGQDTVAGNIEVPNKKNPQGILLLYGGGRKTTKTLFASLQKVLLEKDIASLAIDFPGVGESSGTFTEGSLSQRTAYAVTAYKKLCEYADPKHIAVLGASMGGHVAIRIIKTFPKTQQLILIATAAYTDKAESTPLNEQFTNIITQKNSWESSSVFDVLKKYTGQTLVVYGENDTVIPEGVQKKYMHLAKAKGQVFIVQNGSHRLFSPINQEEKQAQKETVDAIINFLTKIT